jgi:hypothetical protein
MIELIKVATGVNFSPIKSQKQFGPSLWYYKNQNLGGTPAEKYFSLML